MRVPDDLDPVRYQPGDYGRYSQTWFCCTPNGHLGNLSGHTVTEHEDGTITVAPSILVKDRTGELWHGYLVAGEWKPC